MKPRQIRVVRSGDLPKVNLLQQNNNDDNDNNKALLAACLASLIDEGWQRSKSSPHCGLRAAEKSAGAGDGEGTVREIFVTRIISAEKKKRKKERMQRIQLRIQNSGSGCSCS